jgi:2-polyprenyl-3-methyl-5-hydroxy-6-metoxy-1,4-benzoquinol methylase
MLDALNETVPPKAQSRATPAACRSCGATLEHTFVDLGMSPLCQTHIAQHQLNQMEPFYPLHVWVCGECFLVQLEQYVSPADIFTDYAYFSSYSDSWVAHARKYVEEVSARFQLDRSKKVMEIASNDGYLLRHVVARGIPALGIEPAANVAQAAIAKGIPTEVRFFGTSSARQILADHGPADLLIGNNVLAHVPDIMDFVGGLKVLLRHNGVVTMEFPHLMRLMAENQFDTIYHEHFSYLSLHAVERVFAAHRLALFDTEELPTHGGSLRIYVKHAEYAGNPPTGRLEQLRQREVEQGVARLETYASFGEQVSETKRAVLEFLIRAKRQGKTIAGYGAPGKGNTLLNYCGIRQDFLDYTVDRNPHKQGTFTPGTHIPIYAPERIRATRPDYVLILPWNLKEEIMAQLAYVRDWGAQFVIPIPRLEVL